MNETDIRKYAELMQELGLTALEMKEDNVIRIERTVPNVTVAAPEAALAVPTVVNGASAAEEDGYISVTSPMVGVFYAAPAENADPFVSLGDRVAQDSTLCIIEAMKLMNEIRAEVSGEIAEICVTNGQVVEYGTELFRIKR